MDGEDFYTFSEYMKKDDRRITPSMEDYLEMIYRLSNVPGFTRIHELSQALNVQPPSATKMAQRMAELRLVNYEKYGFITLSKDGERIGKMLFERHVIIEHFLKMIGVSESEVFKETEKMEHTISPATVECCKNFTDFMEARPELAEDYQSFVSERK